MLQILERRNRGIDVIIAPVRVQGLSAGREIADAIRLLNKYSKKPGQGIDVIIVGRGGGSMEDLWAFNEEPVARAIFESEIPIVSAVGHETDFTVADFVADLRAPTPSAAAEIAAADAGELNSRINQLQMSLEHLLKFYLLRRRAQLRHLVESRGFAEMTGAVLSLANKRRELEARGESALKENLRSARLKLNELRLRLDAFDFRAPLAIKAARLETLDQKLKLAIRRSVEQGQHNLAVKTSKLDMLSPLAVLGRGYTLVKDQNGRLISRASSVRHGQDLTLQFEDGEVPCQAK
jgi:exodeoxyribonuclease VII large subunit